MRPNALRRAAPLLVLLRGCASHPPRPAAPQASASPPARNASASASAAPVHSAVNAGTAEARDEAALRARVEALLHEAAAPREGVEPLLALEAPAGRTPRAPPRIAARTTPLAGGSVALVRESRAASDDDEESCPQGRGWLVTRAHTLELDAATLTSTWGEGGLQCRARRLRFEGDPLAGPALLRDEAYALRVLWHTSDGWRSVPAPRACALEVAPSPCGRAVYCAPQGLPLASYTERELDATGCVAQLAALDAYATTLRDEARARALASLRAQTPGGWSYRSSATAPSTPPAPPARGCRAPSAAALREALRASAEDLLRRSLAAARAEGTLPDDEAETLARWRRERAAQRFPTRASCVDGQGAFLLAVHHQGEWGPPGEMSSYYRATPQGVALVRPAWLGHDVVREVWLELTGDDAPELVQFEAWWESEASAVRVLSPSWPTPQVVYEDPAPEGLAAGHVVVPLRLGDGGALWLDGAVLRWRGRAFEPLDASALPEPLAAYLRDHARVEALPALLRSGPGPDAPLYERHRWVEAVRARLLELRGARARVDELLRPFAVAAP